MRVNVVTKNQWRDTRVVGGRGENLPRIATSGPMIRFDGHSFYWECPTCGGVATRIISDIALSGWDKPRWTREGTEDAPTLRPSLGCPGLRAGWCTGHWWLTDGELVPA